MQRAGRMVVEIIELCRGRGRGRCFHAPPIQIYAHHDMGTFGFARAPPSFPSSLLSNQSAFQLMAVPKRKVTPSRKRIRNAPKALKPAPLIIRCKICGRVKLPHFFCCTGDKISEEDGSTK